MSRNIFASIEPSQLLDRVKTLKEEGYRYYHACAVPRGDDVELVYAFGKKDEVTGFSIYMDGEKEIDSITFVYWTAFTAELDMARYFGVRFRHVAGDHVDEFYRAEEMSLSAEKVRKEIEFLAETKDCSQLMYAVERMHGYCSFGNSLGYCMAVEKAIGAEIPDRALYLRIVLHELSRIQSHLLWLAGIAQQIGIESLSMRCWKIREYILDAFDRISGNRIMLSICKVGGLKKDIPAGVLEDIRKMMDDLRREFADIEDVFRNDRTINSRLDDLGVLDHRSAADFCVGPAARSAGVDIDVRNDEYLELYSSLGYSSVVEEGGDCHARCRVRLGEVKVSCDVIEKALDTMPGGPVCLEKVEMTEGEGVVRVEQPEGQAVFYVRTGKSDYLERLSVRLPEDVNMPAFVRVMDRCNVSDMPLVALSLEPCINDLKW